MKYELYIDELKIWEGDNLGEAFNEFRKTRETKTYKSLLLHDTATGAAVNEGGRAAVNEGGWADVNEGGWADVNKGGWAAVNEGGWAAVNKGGWAAVNKGGWAAVNEGGVVFEHGIPTAQCADFIREAKNQLLADLAAMPTEAAGLRSYFVEGKINGSAYTGEYCCLRGSEAKLRNCDYTQLPVIADATSPLEVFVYGVRPGDTPANNPICRLIVGWIDEWEASKAATAAIAKDVTE